MSKKLSVDRDYTRFTEDSTFPHTVTARVGTKQVHCSGALLAQHSSVLEGMFRQDNGVLLFKELGELGELGDVEEGILECIRYLHGGDLEFNVETIGVVLKFGSIYKVKDLVKYSLEWLKEYLNATKSVEKAVGLLQLANSLLPCDCHSLKSVVVLFIRLDREIFGTQFLDLLEMGVSGEDMIIIIDEKPVNSGEILKKWASLSHENMSFIARNHSSFLA